MARLRFASVWRHVRFGRGAICAWIVGLGKNMLKKRSEGAERRQRERREDEA